MEYRTRPQMQIFIFGARSIDLGTDMGMDTDKQLFAPEDVSDPRIRIHLTDTKLRIRYDDQKVGRE